MGLSHRFPWYIIHCRSRRERHVANLLQKQLGLDVYLPQSQVKVGRTKEVFSPFFSGYLFVQANLNSVPITSINTIPGVLRLIAFGERPEPVPQTVMDAIFERVNDTNACRVSPQQRFCAGDIVRAKTGSLQDLEMIFVGPTAKQRASVLLHILGQLREVQVDARMLEKIGSPPQNQRRRYTRGKGRKIHYSTPSVCI